MRLIRGLAALLALVVCLAGIPLALVMLAGDPLPAHLSWRRIIPSLLKPDDGSILVALITLVGWAAWIVFVASVLTELVAILSGFRVRITIPGLAGPQRLASGLLLAVVALVAVPVGSVHAAPIPTPTSTINPATASAVASPSVSTAPKDGPGAASPVHRSASDRAAVTRQQTPTMAGSAATSRVHVVERGDDLWSLAQHYYGQGRDWRKIAAANPDRLSGGPDRLQPGWRLTIPDAKPSEKVGVGSVVVSSGDSLSSIAHKAYGQQDKWSEIFAANRDQIQDPDHIEVGARLTLPEQHDAQPLKGKAKHREPPESVKSTDDPSSTPSPTRSATKTTEPPDRSVPPVTGTQPDAPTTVKPTVLPTTSGPTAAEQTTRAPTDAQSTPTPTPTVAQPATSASSPAKTESTVPALDIALGVGSIGGLLAAGVVGGLALRRKRQLQLRPLGRRIPPVGPPAQAVETALGKRQQQLRLESLDLATRAIAAHCHHESAPLPTLIMAKVGPEQIELLMASPAPTAPAPKAPVGFRVAGDRWVLGRDDVHYLSSVPGVAVSARPYPALVSVGRDDEGRQLLVDLENVGLLALDSDVPDDAEALLAAMAVELSFSPWADEMILTLVGTLTGLPEALAKHNVNRCDDMDQVLRNLEDRAEVQRAHRGSGPPGHYRVDPDLADPWAPEIVLVNRPLTSEQEQRLLTVVTIEPRAALAAVVAAPVVGASWSMQLRRDGAHASVRTVRGELKPLGIGVVPQLLEAPAQQAMVELVAVTGSDDTSSAPWWDHTDDPPDVPPPDKVTPSGQRLGGWGTPGGGHGRWQDTSSGQGVNQRIEGSDTVAEEAEGQGAVQHAPILRLLGPVELSGAQGDTPPRASKQCLEYCGWLLEHPGTTALAMASALIVAEGTRRSNMSRLRTWLGTGAAGEAYLPDAYSGRIFLDPAVSSDWQRLQILTAAGVNKTSTGGLRAALELVRGAPLADAAPGQWCWAEELRTDMVSVVRDIGVELSTRALTDHDIDLARWAAARALVAAPGDELLLAARIRTEHQAGNAAETERLTLQLAGQARSLGVDLDQETVVLLQEVMEGQARARLA